ncbi:redoxin domain-containing protein [Emticicia sp. SJ17W-69]|uniref:redoxin domain-containing protein n=1 Tax=Emticicia sp. SJ17W-69 TaxID=3421657 RepID=UPI003EC0A069
MIYLRYTSLWFTHHLGKQYSKPLPTKSRVVGVISLYANLLLIFCSLTINAQKLPTDSEQIFDYKTLKYNKASIVVFFDPECPICQKYTKNLIELDKKYSSEGIKIYVVYPFKVLDKSVLAEFREEYQFNLPIIYDSKRKLLKKLKANYSPEVFLLDNNRKRLYHGAIDNWFYGLGRNRAIPNEFYLLDAINAYKNNLEIKIKYIEPVGCML